MSFGSWFKNLSSSWSNIFSKIAKTSQDTKNNPNPSQTSGASGGGEEEEEEMQI